MSKKRECCFCGRSRGSTKNIVGEEDGTPLGPITKCDTCGRWACPDCLCEADCCFLEAESQEDPNWAPPGWRRATPEEIDPRCRGLADDYREYRRIEPVTLFQE